MTPRICSPRSIAWSVAELVDVLRFSGSPEQGAGAGSRVEWSAYEPPVRPRPILVVSDLGVGVPPLGDDAAPADEWLRFAARVRRAGCPLLTLSPYPAGRVPRRLARRLRVVLWDRTTTAAVARRAAGGRMRVAMTSLEELSPDVVRLAEVVSPAVRVEPELLRHARLVFVPEASAAAEADVWFSPLVESSSPIGFVFHADAAGALRRRLARDPARMRSACALVRRAHRDGSPTLRLEERLIADALGYGSDPDEEGLESVLAAMATDESRRRRLARWALRAIPGLPAATRTSPTASALTAVAEAELGRSKQAGLRIAAGPAADWLRRLLPPATATSAVGLRLLEHGLEVTAPPAGGSHTIEVPAGEPPLLELATRRGRGRWYVADRRTNVFVLTPLAALAAASGTVTRVVLTGGDLVALAGGAAGDLAVAFDDGVVELWPADESRPPHSFRTLTSVATLAFADAESALLVGDRYGVLRAHGLEAPEPGALISTEAFVFTVDADTGAIAWSPGSGRIMVAPGITGPPSEIRWEREITALDMRAGWLAAGDELGSVAVWEPGARGAPANEFSLGEPIRIVAVDAMGRPAALTDSGVAGGDSDAAGALGLLAAQHDLGALRGPGTRRRHATVDRGARDRAARPPGPVDRHRRRHHRRRAGRRLAGAPFPLGATWDGAARTSRSSPSTPRPWSCACSTPTTRRSESSWLSA